MATYLALYASDMAGVGEEWTLVSPAPTRMEIEWNHTDESSRMLFQFPGSDNRLALPVYPYQKVCLVRMDTKPPQTRASISEAPIFYGRVNDIRPVVDTSRGRRTWELTIRDFTQFLADNYVRPADWNPNGSAAWDTDTPTTWGSGGLWTPDYVAAPALRERIIREIVANCLPETVRIVDTTNADRAAPAIANNYNYLGELRIMDLVAGLAKEHPWDASDPPEGMGHFFRQAYGHPPAAGLTATWPTPLADAVFLYARRNKYLWEPDLATTLFAQGRGTPPIAGPGVEIGLLHFDVGPVFSSRVVRITDFDFPTAGHDVFSRAYVYGRGDNVHADGTVDAAMEGTWDPAAYKYAVHREAIEYDESISDPFSENLSQSKLREHGLLVATPHLLRGPTEGWIEVAGLPFSRTTGGLYQDIGTVPPLPGYVIRVWIRDIGMLMAEAYFVERLVWKIPENKSRLYLNRRSFKNLDRVLVGHGVKSTMNTTGVKDFWNTGWQAVNVVGNTFTHNLGVVPHRVDVYAKLKSDSGFATIAKIPAGAYDPVQGQYYGFMITKVTDKEITIKCANFLAYSAGAGAWLEQSTADITIVATPL